MGAAAIATMLLAVCHMEFWCTKQEKRRSMAHGIPRWTANANVNMVTAPTALPALSTNVAQMVGGTKGCVYVTMALLRPANHAFETHANPMGTFPTVNVNVTPAMCQFKTKVFPANGRV